MIDWRELFLNPKGRAPRGRFLIGIGILLLISVLYEGAAGLAFRLLTFWIVDPALLAAAACVLSKRLHDRGHSGWWAALLLFAWVVIWPDGHGARTVLAWLAIGWGAIELGLMPGEQGANRFGPNPLRAAG